ncbi:MAG: flagellar hook-length control protein FliK [Porticoccaceae bacterium]|nr:flagellar hook-length control protein FliK [Porticoccaceae bacterium]
MIDAKNLMLDLGRDPTARNDGLSITSPTKASDSLQSFSGVFKNTMAEVEVAKSGNSLPVSGSDLADSGDPAARLPLPLLSRTLQGGTSLVVGGAEPTEASLLAFAQSQGIDLRALGIEILQKAPDDLAVRGQRFVAQSQGESEGHSLGQSLNQDMNQSLNQSQRYADPAALAQTSPAQTALAQPIDHALTKAEMVAAVQESVANMQLSTVTVEAQRPLMMGQSLDLNVGDKATPLAGPAILAGPAVTSGIAPEIAALAKTAPMAGANSSVPAPQTVVDSMRAALKPVQDPRGSAEQARVGIELVAPRSLPKDIRTSIEQGQLTAQQKSIALNDIVRNILATKTNQDPTSIKVTPPTLVVEGAMREKVAEGTAAKLTFAPSVMDAFIKQFKDRQGLPAVKMAPINLAPNSVAPAPSSLLAAPTVISAENSFAQSPIAQNAAAPSVAAAEMSLDQAMRANEDDLQQDLLRRQDAYTQLSQRLSEALGQRLSAQIARGSWTVEMELHPKTLGRVEVQLEMKNGQLEAHFNAANAATRELIAEGMPRLREILAEHGTETAYTDLGFANQGNSDGKSTGQDSEKHATGAMGAEIDGSSITKSQTITDDGLDVLV